MSRLKLPSVCQIQKFIFLYIFDVFSRILTAQKIISLAVKIKDGPFRLFADL